MIRFVRRPALPGEFNHELIWPLVFAAGASLAATWFYMGWTTPECLFFKLTDYPCLGCGGTRCARQLVHGNLWQALQFHPGFTLLVGTALVWSLYSIYFWTTRSTLRWRVVITDPEAATWRWLIGIGLLLHWLWQCYYLRPLHHA